MTAFFRKINQQQQTCRKIKGIFSRLSKSSFQPPLQKALSTESTFIQEHINRLNLIKSLLVNLKKNIGKPLKPKRIKLKQFSIRNKSNQQDEMIINYALKLFKLMNKDLNVIYKLNVSIEQPIIKTLIEQTIKENTDSIHWLNNITCNVLCKDEENGERNLKK